MKVLSVVGARPQFVKLAAVAAALDKAGHEHVIVHTGQHYDDLMSDVFFADLKIPSPDVHLGVGSGSHGAQTGAMLAGLDPVFDEHRPDWVLIYGDTNSTAAAALGAVKLHLKVAHFEAGMRSFNREMPEEHNRIVADHLSDLLLVPTQVAMDNLAREGLAERSALVGDVQTDVCLKVQASVASSPLPSELPSDLGEEFLVATIHRASNTDDASRLSAVVDGLASLSTPVVLTAHPRLVARAQSFGISLERDALRVIPPLPYPALVRSVMASRGVVTDSGGLQKEAFLLGVPCTTIRTETEWVETLEGGWNVLDNDLTNLKALAGRPAPDAPRGTPYGDGHAAEQSVAALDA
jgi:UDP-N-acetylglucosamine 2-epimerase (non-hydrolysing)